MAKQLEAGTQRPMLQIAANFVAAAVDLVVDTATGGTGATFYTVATPIPLLFNTVGGNQKVHSTNSHFYTLDATAGEEGVVLDKGVYRVDMIAFVGDSAIGGGASSAQLAFVKKDPTLSTDRAILSSVHVTPAVVGATTGVQAAGSYICESSLFRVLLDDSTWQLVGRTATGATQTALKFVRLTITKVANYPEGI